MRTLAFPPVTEFVNLFSGKGVSRGLKSISVTLFLTSTLLASLLFAAVILLPPSLLLPFQ